MTPGVVNVRRKGWCLLAGAVVAAAAWLGPLPGLESFAAHSALHVLVVCVVAPLLAASTAASRADPVRYWPRGFSPLAASFLELLVVWAWHVPAAHLAAREAPALLALQQVSLLVVGVLLWLSVLGGERDARYERVGVGIIALLLTSMHMTVLGVLSMIWPEPLYGGGVPVAGMLEDQRLGGLLLLGGAAIVYVLAGLLLLAWLLRPAPLLARARRTA